jgi:hypothetical protein
MQRNSVRNLSIVAAPILMVCGALVAASPALADNEDKPCSNRTLLGDYGYTADGDLLPAPSVSLPFRSVGMTHFDGRGNLTWVEHTVVNGISLEAGWTAASGNYTVNPDCTGTAVVHTPNSPVPLNLSLIVVKDGKEMRSVLDSNAISSVFTKTE